MLTEERQVTGDMGDMYRKSQGDSTRMPSYTNFITKGVPGGSQSSIEHFVICYNGQSTLFKISVYTPSQTTLKKNAT